MRLYGPTMSLPPSVASGRARRRGAAVLLALLTALPSWVVPAGATTTDLPAAPTTARIVVNGLGATVGPAEDETVPASEEQIGLPSTFTARVVVENLTDDTLDGLRLLVAVHERTTTRSEFRRALDPRLDDAGPIETVAFDQSLDPLPAGGFAQLEVSFPAADAGLLHPDDDVAVHPVTLSLARAFSVLDEVRTAAVGVARPIARPLEALALAPLDGPVERDAAATAQLLPGGRLDRVLRALEQAPTGTVTLAPAPHTTEDLRSLVDQAVPGATDMLTRYGTVVAERGVGTVSSPYALADVPALASSSSTENLATRAIVTGRQRLTSLLGVAPDAAHLLLSTQTDTSVDLAPADVLVTTWDETSGPDLAANPTVDVPPALRTGRSAAGRGLTVLVGDPWVTTHLATSTGAHGWSVDAHRIIAETAMLFGQAPGLTGRVVAVVPPLGWDAPGRLPDELYTRLAEAPWLRLGDPVTVAGRGAISAPWSGAATLAPDRTQLLGRIATAEDRLIGLASAVAGLEEPPAVVTRADELLRTASAWPTTAPLQRAEALLRDIEDAVDEAIGTVRVPDDSVVTLASERGVIPVTIQHPDGVPLEVLVEVAAQGRLTFQDGMSRIVQLEEGGTATVSFEATALSRGTFPMAVTVRTPSRDVVLAGAVVSVRASAVSRPALIAVGVVVLLLLAVGRLRRPREPRLEVVR